MTLHWCGGTTPVWYTCLYESTLRRVDNDGGA